MGNAERWHKYRPGADFAAGDLYKEICIMLLDENRLEIDKKTDNDGSVYYWRMINTGSRIVLHGHPGQVLDITLSDKRRE